MREVGVGSITGGSIQIQLMISLFTGSDAMRLILAPFLPLFLLSKNKELQIATKTLVDEAFFKHAAVPAAAQDYVQQRGRSLAGFLNDFLSAPFIYLIVISLPVYTFRGLSTRNPSSIHSRPGHTFFFSVRDTVFEDLYS